ncbi:hypothetical protein GQ53DRAFT_857035 [Thozetella sp. PMI_491]|nr:hypothetical protein GQ53DRAFT_857035 [Thozetella sp. PMI_491]
MEACCTCARRLAEVPRVSVNEKPFPDDRTLECCGRTICGSCLFKNARFSSYCPYCQVSQSSRSVLPQGLREPPSYTSVAATTLLDASTEAPPPYSAQPQQIIPLPTEEKAALQSQSSAQTPPFDPPAEDTLHFLDHAHDTTASLSLRYGVPVHALRRANNLHSDHLLAARRTILIPGAWYRGGVSLSPRPVEGEEEEVRRSKIRRFMVATKVADYDMAVLYLDAADYELEEAVAACLEDEKWEKAHPIGEDGQGAAARLPGNGKNKASALARGLGSRGRTRPSQAAFLRRS